MGSKQVARIVKMVDLAISAAAIGNEHEAHAAAYRAGSCALHAGIALETMWSDLPELQNTTLWNVVVDGYYDSVDA